MILRCSLRALAVLVLCLFSAPSHAAMNATTPYAKTRHPIVLCHGMAGFDSVLGILDYWYGIDAALREAGATVYVTHVSAFSSPEARGEQLLAQLEELAARTGAQKLNLIAHSQGGLDVRYVAAVRPDLVASLTTIGTPHRGAELADLLRGSLRTGGFTEGLLSHFTGSLGTLLGILTGHTSPQDAVAGLESLTTARLAQFNARYPAGLPSSACGSRPQSGGTHYYSWSGTATWTHLLDVVDNSLKLAGLLYGEANDGLVGKCSSHFGQVLRDDYRMNHLDEVNQILGMTSLFETNVRSVFRAHANRLKGAGL